MCFLLTPESKPKRTGFPLRIFLRLFLRLLASFGDLVLDLLSLVSFSSLTCLFTVVSCYSPLSTSNETYFFECEPSRMSECLWWTAGSHFARNFETVLVIATARGGHARRSSSCRGRRHWTYSFLLNSELHYAPFSRKGFNIKSH